MTIWLDDLAKAVIQEEARGRRFSETGGPIFGYESSGRDAVVVAAVFGPGPKARHRPRSLVADRAATEDAIRQVHELTEGRYRYLGSWHTHPLGQPHPSSTDTTTAQDIASQQDVGIPRPVLLIQATRPARRSVGMGRLAAYRWNPATERMEELPMQVVELAERLVTSSQAAVPAEKIDDLATVDPALLVAPAESLKLAPEESNDKPAPPPAP
jgi:integrative and conjugative element protein (TIGR02256 family)